MLKAYNVCRTIIIGKIYPDGYLRVVQRVIHPSIVGPFWCPHLTPCFVDCHMQALYWVWDNMCFLNRIKFIEIDCDKAAYRSDVAWYVHSSTH